jgi:hypothetical protein
MDACSESGGGAGFRAVAEPIRAMSDGDLEKPPRGGANVLIYKGQHERQPGFFEVPGY